MSATLALALAGLGLLDSTSFGTLLIPIWLLLTPGRVRAGRIAVYLATVATFYLCVGVLLVVGADAVLEAVRAAFADVAPTHLRIGQLVLGLIVIALSYRLEARARSRAGKPGRLQRWRTAAMSGAVPDSEGPDGRDVRGGGVRGLMSLALVATALEIVTMVPYLAAVGLLANADLTWQAIGGALAGYCIVMILPAVLLGTVRIAAHDRAEPVLQRINDWFTRNSAKALGWTVGGIGIGMVLNAVIALLAEPA
ncbi:GAP family protein [Streptomyces sp. DH10]|uniref:GAP family protein n=1 Tax=Streptomyces sp. DH10 TaxID=3040121 RepID=UPI00244180FE|nr:GAP family protein [Streptomyces sp. DH10]MDG9709274.1 GAP family protein [Streptomyces sp. DH10]